VAAGSSAVTAGRNPRERQPVNPGRYRCAVTVETVTAAERRCDNCRRWRRTAEKVNGRCGAEAGAMVADGETGENGKIHVKRQKPRKRTRQ